MRCCSVKTIDLRCRDGARQGFDDQADVGGEKGGAAPQLGLLVETRCETPVVTVAAVITGVVVNVIAIFGL